MSSNMLTLSDSVLFLTVRLYYFSDTDANINTDKYSSMENKLLA